MQRYAGATALTTAKCEGCGRRLGPGDLYALQADDLAELTAGTSFTFTYSRLGDVVITRIFNTVCSRPCDALATTRKQPQFYQEIAAAQHAAGTSHVKARSPRRPRRASLKYRKQIAKAVGAS